MVLWIISWRIFPPLIAGLNMERRVPDEVFNADYRAILESDLERMLGYGDSAAADSLYRAYWDSQIRTFEELWQLCLAKGAGMISEDEDEPMETAVKSDNPSMLDVEFTLDETRSVSPEIPLPGVKSRSMSLSFETRDRGDLDVVKRQQPTKNSVLFAW